MKGNRVLVDHRERVVLVKRAGGLAEETRGSEVVHVAFGAGSPRCTEVDNTVRRREILREAQGVLGLPLDPDLCGRGLGSKHYVRLGVATACLDLEGQVEFEACLSKDSQVARAFGPGQSLLDRHSELQFYSEI